MDQADHHHRPPLPRREPTATSGTNPQWDSPDDPDFSGSGAPPPPYSLYEEAPPPPVPGMRPAVTMPIQTGFRYNPATYSDNGQSPTIPSFDPPPIRPVSRGNGNGYNPSQYQQPNPGPASQSLHPPNRLRVMTSMPNMSSTASRFDHSPVSSISSRPASPSMTAFTPSPATAITPNHRPWPEQSRPTTPVYQNLPPPPPPPSGPLPPPPPPRPGPRPLQPLPTSKAPTSNPALISSSPKASSATPKSLLNSALHFAGGLIPHPYESTKHHTILRHSPALIFYRGPKTSLAITIFSSPSYPLPLDRSLWLQQRGFSGDTGLKLKQLVGATSTWLDVTPSTQVQTSDLEPSTAKAWERDIAKAARKLSRELGDEKAHVPRQTHVVRIPEAAEDGYFRLVLCVGGVEGSKDKKRKVVCQSPVFRVASTSSDSSVLKGASLSTMPIEMGVKVASFMASNVVQRYAAPVTAIADRVRPGLVKEEVGKRVFKAVGDRVKQGPRQNGNEGQFYGSGGGTSRSGEDMMGLGTMAVGMGTGMGGMVVGGEEGPEQPFPIKFQGRVGRGTGKGMQELGMPTANLVAVPDDIKANLRGVYFGWACFLAGRGVDPAIVAENCWYEAVIMATKSAYASVIQETDIKVYLAHEFGDGMVSFTEAKMKVIVMGFIRPEVQPARGTVASVQDRLEMASQDVMVTMASLSRENWGPDMTLDRLKTAKSSRSLSDKFGDVKTKVQRTVDKVPGHAHVAGIRVGGGEERDRIHGTGGYWVAR
ncbi:hypothetical protein V8F20_002907 [Naviculisporaceae sp. PSN 640]